MHTKASNSLTRLAIDASSSDHLLSVETPISQGVQYLFLSCQTPDKPDAIWGRFKELHHPINLLPHLKELLYRHAKEHRG